MHTLLHEVLYINIVMRLTIYHQVKRDSSISRQVQYVLCSVFQMAKDKYSVDSRPEKKMRNYVSREGGVLKPDTLRETTAVWPREA